MNVVTTRLFYQVRQNALCEGLYCRAEAGKITGIMGPSGAGKSIFLKLLTGYLRPSSGRVLVGGVDITTEFKCLRGRVGYVPQAEAMIPELTVAESLHYRLRLQAPRLSRAERENLIRETCEKLGLGSRFSKLGKLRIGNPFDARGAHPSGGERRRIHMAHELLSGPEVLFLDEPTSGLSIVDAESVVALLKHLAREQGMNVIMTVHQPSPEMFGRLDELILISMGGRLAYYGDADRAAEYFQHAGKVRMAPGRNPADFVMEFIPEDQDAIWAEDAFQDALDAGGFAFLRTPSELSP